MAKPFSSSPERCFCIVYPKEGVCCTRTFYTRCRKFLTVCSQLRRKLLLWMSFPARHGLAIKTTFYCTHILPFHFMYSISIFSSSLVFTPSIFTLHIKCDPGIPLARSVPNHILIHTFYHSFTHSVYKNCINLLVIQTWLQDSLHLIQNNLNFNSCPVPTPSLPPGPVFDH